MKADFLFVGLNINTIIQKKKRQEKAHFVDDALKSSGNIYLNVDVVVVCLIATPLWKFLATRLLPGRPILDPMDSGIPADFASTPKVDEVGKELQSERCGVAMRRTHTSQQVENGSYCRGISG